MSNMYDILCASLAQEIGKDEILCRGLLRITVTNSVRHLQQISDPVRTVTETTAYISRMGYQDWKNIIDGPRLTQILANVGVKDPPNVIARLMQILVEQQSMFTMAAR